MNMPNKIKDYRKLVDEPWGRMFYELIYEQLSLPSSKKLCILDFGAGFCITANHYAKQHTVTAVEPSAEMSRVRKANNNYEFILGDIHALKCFADGSFDVVLCHNVLEYTDDKEGILQELSRVLKSGGILSIVKHNLYGRILSEAVLNDEPAAALRYLDKKCDNTRNMFGKRNTYSNEYLINTAEKLSLGCKEIFGIRTMFALSSNNKIKYTDEWYRNMLALELKAGSIDDFKNIAFFNHLTFEKKEH